MDGQQPRYTSIERNYVREIGIIEKQSSMWFQAKSALTNLDSNVRARRDTAFPGTSAAILPQTDGFACGAADACSKTLPFCSKCRLCLWCHLPGQVAFNQPRAAINL